ncbi:MAG: glycine dehydrogenase, partial [Gemmataceae bacterium]|nr:glycine dehydrogenase [Gemmataceae bacterium]
LRAAVYLTALGPQGLRETAELCLQKAHYLADKLANIGAAPAFARPFFKEFTIRFPGDVDAMLRRMVEAGYLAGLPLGRWYPTLRDCVSIAVTEKRTRAELDGYVEALRKLL